MTALGRLPGLGGEVADLGHRFTVVEVDGRRPSRLRVEPLERADGGVEEAGASSGEPSEQQSGQRSGQQSGQQSGQRSGQRSDQQRSSA